MSGGIAGAGSLDLAYRIGRTVTIDLGTIALNKSAVDTVNALTVTVSGGTGLSALFAGALLVFLGQGPIVRDSDLRLLPLQLIRGYRFGFHGIYRDWQHSCRTRIWRDGHRRSHLDRRRRGRDRHGGVIAIGAGAKRDRRGRDRSHRHRASSASTESTALGRARASREQAARLLVG